MPIRSIFLVLLAGAAGCAREEPKEKRNSPPLAGARLLPLVFPAEVDAGASV